MAFERVPSPDLDPTRIPAAELAVSTSRRPLSLHSSKQNVEDDKTPTPTAFTPPDMPFNTLMDTEPPYRRFSQPSPASNSTTRVTTSESSSRDETIRPVLPKPTPAQLAKWKKEEEIVTMEVLEQFEGDACIIRYESKHGWMGFWNRFDIENVLDELRELRLPKT
jgi:hypothetical protein